MTAGVPSPGGDSTVIDNMLAEIERLRAENERLTEALRAEHEFGCDVGLVTRLDAVRRLCEEDVPPPGHGIHTPEGFAGWRMGWAGMRDAVRAVLDSSGEAPGDGDAPAVTPRWVDLFGIDPDFDLGETPSGGIEDLARRFHEAYERLAPSFGYETRRESAVPWDRVPEQNRALMVAVVAEVFGAAASRREDTR